MSLLILLFNPSLPIAGQQHVKIMEGSGNIVYEVFTRTIKTPNKILYGSGYNRDAIYASLFGKRLIAGLPNILEVTA